MTKPTGRPRGRPKTKEYVTLMARVDVALADQVKCYASLHRQPISVVIRDALALLIDEYPPETDRTSPHRLSAHEFLSDRYESPLDTLLEEADSAARDALMSDTNGAIVETVLSDTNGERVLLSDMNRDSDIMSDSNRNDSMSDMNRGADLASDKKKVSPDIVSDMNIPPFDTSKYVLGAKLCPGKHEYAGTGRTLVTRKGRKCPACQIEGQQQRRAAQRQGHA